jgi:hypothetical protein
MQESSSSRNAGVIQNNDAFINSVRSNARSLSFFVSKGLSGLFGRMKKTLFLSPTSTLVRRHEVAIMYFGRTSEFLMITS